MSGPLSAVRVCDLTVAYAGPVCTAILADFGAEVIKVENVNARLDAGSALTVAAAPERPHAPAYDRMPDFHQVNRGKRSITLNLQQPEGYEALLRLTTASDVVVQNFSPRVVDHLGLGYDALRQGREDLIMLSMPALGSSGPYRNRTAFGPGIDAMSGLCELTGFPDDPPTKPGHVLPDFTGGLSGAFALLAALYHRRETGRGQHIELALREAYTYMAGEQLLEAAATGGGPERRGNRHPTQAPHGVYPCRGDDEWVAVSVGSDDEWARLRGALGNPEWAADPRLTETAGRLARQAEIDRHLCEWTRQRTKYEVTRRLQTAGVKAGAALSGRDQAEDAHFIQRGFLQPVPTASAGVLQLARPGYRLSRTPPTLQPGPDFADGLDAVLGGLLGYTTEQIAGMESIGAVSRKPVQL